MKTATQLASLAFATLTSTGALASGTPHNHDEIDVAALKRWAQSDVSFEVASTSTFIEQSAVVDAVEGALMTWNNVGTGPMLAVKAGTDGVTHPVEIDGVNRIGVWSDGAWPYPEMAGAVTLVYSRPGTQEIGEVDIALNPAFAWTIDPTGQQGKYDLQNVLVHEVGHALGLPDLKDLREASMFYMILRGETLKRDVNEDDEAMLLSLYEGVELDLDADSTGGCNAAGSTPATMFSVLGLLAITARTTRTMNRTNRRSPK
jgi:hypothetical protein